MNEFIYFRCQNTVTQLSQEVLLCLLKLLIRVPSASCVLIYMVRTNVAQGYNYFVLRRKFSVKASASSPFLSAHTCATSAFWATQGILDWLNIKLYPLDLVAFCNSRKNNEKMGRGKMEGGGWLWHLLCTVYSK